MVTWVPLNNICNCGFKENCKTTVHDYTFKENCKTIVRDCGFKENYEATICDCGFMVILIKNILKIILKSQYH